MNGFLGRWSRLKAESGAKRPAVAVDIEKTVPPPLPPAEAAAPEPPPAEIEPPADLPPVESLGRDSDYSRFLKDDVPDHLRKLALRKLWATDPALSAMDPLDLHNLDYSFPTVPEIVATTYRVGKGFADTLERVGEQGAEMPSPEAEAGASTTKVE